MSFTKRLRSWFFRGDAPINPNVLDEDGNATLRDNLANRGVPTQNTMQDLTASAAFFTEAGDRAKLSTGGAIKNEVGLVTVAPDTDVVNAGVYVGNTGLEADRTKVVHAQQLTEVDEVSQSIGYAPNDVPTYNAVIIEKNQDAATTTRNRFVPRFAAGFITWIQDNILPRLIKSGGTAGQVLEKVDGTDYNVQWVTPAAVGETNDAANVGGGTGEVYRDKTGTTINLKTINSADSYTDVTNNADTIDVGVDEAALLSYMQSNLSFPSTDPTTTWNTLNPTAINPVFIGGDTSGSISWADNSSSIKYMQIGTTIYVSIYISGVATASSPRASTTQVEVRITTSSMGNPTGGFYGNAHHSWSSGTVTVGGQKLTSDYFGTTTTYFKCGKQLTIDSGDTFDDKLATSWRGMLTYETT